MPNITHHRKDEPIKKSVSLVRAEIAASLIEHGVQVRIAKKVAMLLATESIKNVVIQGD